MVTKLAVANGPRKTQPANKAHGEDVLLAELCMQLGFFEQVDNAPASRPGPMVPRPGQQTAARAWARLASAQLRRSGAGRMLPPGLMFSLFLHALTCHRPLLFPANLIYIALGPGWPDPGRRREPIREGRRAVSYSCGVFSLVAFPVPPFRPAHGTGRPPEGVQKA